MDAMYMSIMCRHWINWPIKFGPISLEVRQYEPCKRTVTIASSFSPDGKLYYLQFPYMIFARYKRSLRAAFSLDPIQSDKFKICFPTLPNINNRYQVCLNDKNHFCASHGIDRMIDEFWSAGFFHSLSHAWPGGDQLFKVFGSFPKWAKLDLMGVNNKLRRGGRWQEFERMIEG